MGLEKLAIYLLWLIGTIWVPEHAQSTRKAMQHFTVSKIYLFFNVCCIQQIQQIYMKFIILTWYASMNWAGGGTMYVFCRSSFLTSSVDEAGRQNEGPDADSTSVVEPGSMSSVEGVAFFRAGKL